MNMDEFMSACNIKQASETLPENIRELFIKFMIYRFHETPNFTHISYAMEWAGRFNGDPRGAMDTSSRATYEELLKHQQ